jgi:thymidylate synthase (FAD)
MTYTKEIKCLDHGYVRYVDHMGSDSRIVEAARVSYQGKSKGEEADKKLLGYLWKNKHTSPFEMCKLTLNIKMPIFVMRQYVRHRMQNLNEVSARYSQLPAEFYIPEKWRAQDVQNKQGSVEAELKLKHARPVWDMDGSTFMSCDPSLVLSDHCRQVYQLYESLLESGIAREMARFVLPVNIYTECYACWDLKNLLHFIALRDDSHAQAEIQVYGKAIKEICTDLFPWTMEAYAKYQWKLQEA